jgi:hypothetical protein
VVTRQRVVVAAEEAQGAQFGGGNEEQSQLADVVPVNDVTRVTCDRISREKTFPEHNYFPRKSRTHQRTLLLRQAAASTARWATSSAPSATTNITELQFQMQL